MKTMDDEKKHNNEQTAVAAATKNENYANGFNQSISI